MAARCRSASAALPNPRGLAPARDDALELAVELHAPDGGVPLEQAPAFAAAGPVDRGVVCEPGVLEADGVSDVLPGVQPLSGRGVADGGRSLAGEGQDLARVAHRPGGGGFLGEPLADPGVDGPPGGVGMAAEASLGQVPDRDGAVDAHIGERPAAPFAEGDGPALPVRGVFPAMTVPHAVSSAAWWRGGTQVRSDRSVEHLLGSFRWPQRRGPKLRVGTGSGSSGLTECCWAGARAAAMGSGSRSASRSRLRASTKSEIFCASAAARRISRGSSSSAATQPST